jgi:ABC-type oligopeptide transport system substrate-binding subunit
MVSVSAAVGGAERCGPGRRARRLAGDRSRRAVLYTCDFPHCLEHGRVVRKNLAAIGVDVEVKNFPLQEMFERLHRPGEPWDISYNNWFIDFADPSQFIESIFAAPSAFSNLGNFNDKKILRRIRTATGLAGTSRSRAFAQLDADLASAGAGAPFASGITADFFSDRIGCQVHEPIYGIAFGALCVRDR